MPRFSSGGRPVTFMVDIAVEQVFHLMLVSYSTSAKCSLRGGTMGNNTKGLFKKKQQKCAL